MCKVRPIDRALFELEKAGDLKGLHLEDVDGYTKLCDHLTDLDIWGSSELLTKEECMVILDRCIRYIFPKLSDDPQWWFKHKILEVYY